MGVSRALLAVVASVLLGACTRELPDPASAGARLYRDRCSGCHLLFAPGSLTAAMWELQVDRMQPVLARGERGPLTAEERRVMLEYLQAHSTNAPRRAPGTG